MNNHRITPEGLNPLSTMICVQDANYSVEFYVNIFGFRSHQIMTDRDGKVMFARLLYHGINLIVVPIHSLEEDEMSPPIMCPCPPQVNFYVYCQDLDKIYNTIKQFNLQILHEKEVKFWGDVVFKVVDPNGYIWSFASRDAEHDASKISIEVL